MKTEKNNANLLMAQSIIDQLNLIDPLGTSDDPMETRRPNLRPFTIQTEGYDGDVVIVDHWIDEMNHDHWTLGNVWRNEPSSPCGDSQWLIVSVADYEGTTFRGIRTDVNDDDIGDATFQTRWTDA